LLRIDRCRALKRICNHKSLSDETAGILEQKLAKLLLVCGIDLLRVLIDVVIPMRDPEKPLGGISHIPVEVRDDKTAGTAIDSNLEVDLFDGPNDQDEVVQV